MIVTHNSHQMISIMVDTIIWTERITKLSLLKRLKAIILMNRRLLIKLQEAIIMCIILNHKYMYNLLNIHKSVQMFILNINSLNLIMLIYLHFKQLNIFKDLINHINKGIFRSDKIHKYKEALNFLICKITQPIHNLYLNNNKMWEYSLKAKMENLPNKYNLAPLIIDTFNSFCLLVSLLFIKVVWKCHPLTINKVELTFKEHTQQ